LLPPNKIQLLFKVAQSGRSKGDTVRFFVTRRVYHDRVWMTSTKQDSRPCDKMYIDQNNVDGFAAYDILWEV
jgi:hypothetical protein